MVGVAEHEKESPPGVNVVYYVELPVEIVRPDQRGKMLTSLITQPMTSEEFSPRLVDHLANGGNGISLALSDIDEDTAAAIRILNESNVPVIGWVVLPDNLGYWTNAANVEETRRVVENIFRKTERYNIRLAGLGFDSEIPISLSRAFNQINPRCPSTIWDYFIALEAYRKAKINERQKYGDPQRNMDTLLWLLRERGITTETYVMTGVGEFLFNQLRIESDRTVEMLYTSTAPRILQPLILGLMRNRRTIPALGIYSGIKNQEPGRDLCAGKMPGHLSYTDLLEDLRVLMRQGVISPRGEKLGLRQTYLFALNHPSVVTDMERALACAAEATKRSL